MLSDWQFANLNPKSLKQGTCLIRICCIEAKHALYVQPQLRIFIISISVMNLVTAALVEGTLENARMLRQEEERHTVENGGCLGLAGARDLEFTHSVSACLKFRI